MNSNADCSRLRSEVDQFSLQIKLLERQIRNIESHRARLRRELNRAKYHRDSAMCQLQIMENKQVSMVQSKT